MKRAAWWILLVVSAAACRGREPLYLGIVLDDDGTGAARLAEAEFRRAGRIDGRPLRMRIVAPAIQRDSARLLAAVDSLAADTNVVAVVGPGRLGAGLAAARLLNARGVPHIVPAPTGAEPDSIGPFSFRLVPNGEEQARFIVAQALALRPGSRTAIVYADNDYGRRLRALVRRELARRGGRIVHESTFEEDADTASLRALAIGIEEARPGTLLWLGRGKELWMILPPLRAGLPQALILGSDAVESDLLYRGSGEALSGLLFVRHADPQATEERVADFRTRYVAWVMRQPTSRSMLAYDAIHLLAEALRAGARTRAEVQRYLASVGRERAPFSGIAGEIRFDERRQGSGRYFLAEVTDYGVKPVATRGAP